MLSFYILSKYYLLFYCYLFIYYYLSYALCTNLAYLPSYYYLYFLLSPYNLSNSCLCSSLNNYICLRYSPSLSFTLPSAYSLCFFIYSTLSAITCLYFSILSFYYIVFLNSLSLCYTALSLFLTITFMCSTILSLSYLMV